MEKAESLPPADLHFQISAKVKFQIQVFFLDFSASPARLLDTFSTSDESFMGSLRNFQRSFKQISNGFHKEFNEVLKVFHDR